MSPTTAIVSTSDRPFTLVRFIYGLLLFLTLTLSTLAQETAPIPVTFRVSPSYAKVFVVDNGLQEFPANQEVFLQLSPDLLQGKKKLTVRFVVPRGQKGKLGVDKDAYDEQVFVEVQDLKRERKFPSDRVFELNLPFPQRFLGFIYNRSALASALLLLILGAGVGLFKMRRQIPKWLNAQPVPGYTLGESLGTGGMGEVVAATSEMGMDCAIKFLKAELTETEEFKKRFKREVEGWLPLRHDHLLRLYDSGTTATDGRPYMVCERLYGSTLKDCIAEGVADPPQLAIKIVEQIGDALSYLHENNLVHRDIKPDNIFVCKDGDLKLLDMGLLQGEELTVLTQTGQVLGTPAYMPPEQVRNKTNPASDQYSLGIILYEILAGRRPFIQPDMVMLAYQHRHAAPQPPSELEPRIPAEVESVILKMLEKTPEDRFSSMKDVQNALAETLAFMSWGDCEETGTAQIKPYTPPS